MYVLTNVSNESMYLKILFIKIYVYNIKALCR